MSEEPSVGVIPQVWQTVLALTGGTELAWRPCLVWKLDGLPKRLASPSLGAQSWHGAPVWSGRWMDSWSALLVLSKEDGALFLAVTGEVGLPLQLSQHLSLKTADIGALGRLLPAGVFTIKDRVILIQFSNNNFLLRRGWKLMLKPNTTSAVNLRCCPCVCVCVCVCVYIRTLRHLVSGYINIYA